MTSTLRMSRPQRTPLRWRPEQIGAPMASGVLFTLCANTPTSAWSMNWERSMISAAFRVFIRLPPYSAQSPFTTSTRWTRPTIQTRNVSNTVWKHRHSMDAALDVTAGKRTRTGSAHSPATASLLIRRFRVRIPRGAPERPGQGVSQALRRKHHIGAPLGDQYTECLAIPGDTQATSRSTSCRECV